MPDGQQVERCPSENASRIVRTALRGSGVELVASCSAALFNDHAPEAFQSHVWMKGARGLVVAASAGPALWRKFRAHMDAVRSRWDEAHPLDHYVSEILALADEALASRGVRFRRFEAAFHATPRIDFTVLARLVGLGFPGPFGMLIHVQHGPWWALRGAWLVDAEVEPPNEHRPPCVGCAAPCIGGWVNGSSVVQATPQVRARCVVGQASRYDEDQIAYHYDRAATVLRLRKA